MPLPVAQLRLESERKLAVVVTTLILLPGVLWAYVDQSLVTEPWVRVLLHSTRAAQLLVWLAGIVLIRRAQSKQALERVLFGLALGIVAFLGTNAWLRPADNFMPLRIIILISIGTFVVYPYRFKLQLIALLALAATTASLLWGHYTSMPGVERYAFVLNFVLAGVLGMMIARNREALDRDLDEALVRERHEIEGRERAAAALKTLEGIIPICSYCHEVRTEAGAWEQLDSYVNSRTEAQFSHGICPHCAAEHFPRHFPRPPGA